MENGANKYHFERQPRMTTDTLKRLPGSLKMNDGVKKYKIRGE